MGAIDSELSGTAEFAPRHREPQPSCYRRTRPLVDFCASSAEHRMPALTATGGHPLKLREPARRAGDPPVLVADPTAIMRAFGWRPRHSSLEEIVRTALRWHARKASR